jgi:tRNA dimethylallyltransferase
MVGEALGAEIVSMDSRQVYRGMDIGTGKVGLPDRCRLPHHGLDLLDPDERYSAGQFARDARNWIRDIQARRRVTILVGGTGFFLKALTDPMFQQPKLDQERLERLRVYLNRLPSERLAQVADRLDPRGRESGTGDRQRATRSIEMALLTGRPLSWWHSEAGPKEDPLTGMVVLLDPPREALYEKINRRVGEMVSAGLKAEVAALLEAGYGPDDPGMTGAGYREMVEYLTGKTSLEEAVEGIRRSHRRYARRQITWFRHQLPPHVLTVSALEPGREVVGEITTAWAQWPAAAEGRVSA